MKTLIFSEKAIVFEVVLSFEVVKENIVVAALASSFFIHLLKFFPHFISEMNLGL